jgi:hypothetical protein
MKLLRKYVYVDTDDFDDKHLRIDLWDLKHDVLAWIERKRKSDHDRAWDAFQMRVRWWAEATERWDRWQDLEQRRITGEGQHLTFSDHLDLQMYRAEAGIKRDMNHQMFGGSRQNGKLTRFTGLAGLLKGSNDVQNFLRLQQPKLIRSMQETLNRPNKLWERIQPTTSSMFVINPDEFLSFDANPNWDQLATDDAGPLTAKMLSYGQFMIGEKRRIGKLTPVDHVVAWYPEGSPEERVHLRQADVYDWGFEQRYDHRYEEWHDMGGDA